MKLFLNEDNDHYFKLGDEYLTEAAMRRYIGGYAAMGVDTISFCVMGQRANYASKYMDAIWDPLLDGSLSSNGWCVRLKRLHDGGIDPYFIWFDECRKRGITPWLSFRMNDVHQVHPSLAYRADRDWFRHFEWTRQPQFFPPEPGRDWQYYQDLQEFAAWNYALPEVRRKMLGLMKEAASRYDVPCYELDFCRDPFCLTPGHEGEEAPILTALLQDFRDELDKLEVERGRRHEIAVRVPYVPEVSRDWGFDVADWCRRRLVSTVIPSSYWRSFIYDVPLAQWRTIVGEGVRVIPSVDQWVTAGPDVMHSNTTLPFLLGWCDCMDQAGADAVYVFNLPYFNDPACVGTESAREFQPWFKERFSLAQVWKSHRRYQAGYLDFVSPGKTCTGQFPVALQGGKPQTFLYPAVTIPACGKVTVTPVFKDDAATGCAVLLNGCGASEDGAFGVASLSPEGNQITLTAAAPACLENLYLDVFPDP